MPEVQKIKTTMMLDAALYEEFAGIVKAIGLRRDAMLSKWLEAELNYLREIKPNSSAQAKLRKLLRADGVGELKKVVFTLNKSVVDELNAICREKGILRDAFVESYLRYLLKDDQNDMGPPLYRMLELIEDPRCTYGFLPDGERSMPYDELSIELRLEQVEASLNK